MSVPRPSRSEAAEPGAPNTGTTEPRSEVDPSKVDPPATKGSEDDRSELDSFEALLRQVASAPSVDLAGKGEAIQESLVGKRLSHFQVVERIGAGGMGVVYKGEDSRLRRPVALKVLPPKDAGDRSRQQRLLREARSAAAVSHPNIASIYEVGEEDGVAFIAMEFLEGETLRSKLGDPPRAPDEVLRWCLQIAQGLARAHMAGIVHRDLKPDNVMLCRDGLIKILDFGVAKPRAALAPAPPPVVSAARPPAKPGDESESGSFDGQIVGTPRYMSPEQRRGEAVDARSDVYSFGVMLVELCLGVQAGRDPLPAAQRVLELRPLPPHGVLRQGLLRVALQCLDPSPAKRFVDGTALLVALQQLALAHESLFSAQVTPQRLPGRARYAVALVLAAAAVVAAVLIIKPPGPGGPQKVCMRRLTFNPPENPIADAAIAPGGKTLAYLDRQGLWLQRLEPTRREQVREQLKLPERFTPQSVSWFPRRDELLVMGLSPGVEGSSAWVIDVSGKVRQLGPRMATSPRVSPDGRSIAWIAPEGIVVGDAAMESPRLLVKLERENRLDRAFDQLAWSPDGHRLAYLRDSLGADGDEASLETVDVRTGEVKALLSDPRLVLENGHGALTWAPDGRLFYVVAERPPHESGASLRALRPDPDTGEAPDPPKTLQGWMGNIYPGALTVSGSGALAYVLYESQVDVYVAQLEEGGRRLGKRWRATLTDHNEQPSGWTPDGKGVLFMSDQDGLYDVSLQDAQTQTEGTYETRLLVRGAPLSSREAPDSHTWPELAPGGKSVLYWNLPLRDDDQPHPAELMRVPFEGGKPVHVLTTQHAAREGTGLPPSHAHFRCPTSGRMCVLGEIDNGHLVLTSFDPYTGHGGTLMRLADPGDAHGWDVSPAGDKVAMPYGGRIRIVELVSGRTQERIVDLSCDLQFVTWAASGDSLFATGVCQGEQPYKIFFVEPGHSPQVLWDPSYAWVGHPSASPDGKHLAFAFKPFDNDVWTLTACE